MSDTLFTGIIFTKIISASISDNIHTLIESEAKSSGIDKISYTRLCIHYCFMTSKIDNSSQPILLADEDLKQKDSAQKKILEIGTGRVINLDITNTLNEMICNACKNLDIDRSGLFKLAIKIGLENKKDIRRFVPVLQYWEHKVIDIERKMKVN